MYFWLICWKSLFIPKCLILWCKNVTLRASSSGTTSLDFPEELCEALPIKQPSFTRNSVRWCRVCFYLPVSSLLISLLRWGLSRCLILRFPDSEASSLPYKLIPNWSIAILNNCFFYDIPILSLLTIIPVLGSSSSVVLPNRSNRFSNEILSYCSWLYLYSVPPFSLTFGSFMRGLCLSEAFPLVKNFAISPFSLIP